MAVTPDGWQARLTQTVAREIRRHRDRQKLSAQQLADRTAELGMPIPRNVLANLESGRRGTVSVAEILVVAAALGVAPMELICPVGYDEQLETLPGRTMDPLTASRWIDGELVLDVSGPKTMLRAPKAGDESGTRLAEQHAATVAEVEGVEAEVARCAQELDFAQTSMTMAEAAAADAEGLDHDSAAAEAKRAEAAKYREAAARARSQLDYRTSVAAKYRDAAEQSIRYVRAEMRHRGMILPPLPASLKGADDTEEGVR